MKEAWWLLSTKMKYIWSELTGYYYSLLSVDHVNRTIWFEVLLRRGFLNIIPTIEDCLRESNVQEGLALVNAMHITASVFINDDESSLHHDYEVWLEKLAPHAPVDQYRQNGYERVI